MKHLITLFLCLLGLHAFAHEGVDLGPNGGRLLLLDKKTSLHGEVLVKGDRFYLTLLDSRKKPIALTTQSLTASSRTSIVTSTKLEVTRTTQEFTFPLVKSGAWLVLQYRADPALKPQTTRFSYDTSICSGCGRTEWLCGCH